VVEGEEEDGAYRVAKTHRMPYLSRSFSIQDPRARGDGAL